MSAIGQFLVLLAAEIAGLFALWFILRARIRRYLDIENLLAGVRDEARALVIELNETADRNVSLVEDKMAALRDLLDETDRRIGVARRELDTREAEREVFARLSRRRPIVPGEDRREDRREDSQQPRAQPSEGAFAGPEERPRAAPPAQPARSAQPIPLVLGARSPAAPGNREAEAGSDDGGAPARIPEVAVAAQRIAAGPTPREEALRLHRQGFSVDVIAARSGVSVAEVELLIELDQRRGGG